MLEEFLKQYAEDNSIAMPAKQTEEQSAKTTARKQHLKYHLDKRRGKTATIITAFNGTDEELEAFASTLKQKLAVGGSVRDGEILLQGDVIEKVKKLLIQMELT